MSLGGPLGGSTTNRGPWAFLYQGLESEPPDAPKLPNGNIYNPDPFQVSPQGPIGMGGGGGGGLPHGLGGHLSSQNANLLKAGLDEVWNVISIYGGVRVRVGDASFGFDLNPFDWFLGDPSSPKISAYDKARTQRGPNPTWEQFTHAASDLYVTQKGVQVAQTGGGDEGDEGGDEGNDIARTGLDKQYVDEVNSDQAILVNMGRPLSVQTADAFAGWLKTIQDSTGSAVSSQQATAIAREAKRLGLNVRLDPGHTAPGNPWNRPHLNIWISDPTKSAHVIVPGNFKLP